MSSKVFAFLALLFAFVVLISSEVAARDLAETSVVDNKHVEATAETNGSVEDAKHGGGECHGGGGRYGRCHKGGRYGPGGHCRHGCCGYHGGCSRCCSYAGEAPDAEPEVKPHN